MLWDDPNGYDYGRFLRDRKRESDPRTWSALYQQEPTPEEGDYFRAEWLLPVDNVPKASELLVYGGSDYAVTADGGDYTVHAVVGLDADENPYVLDIWRRQASSDVWVDAWCDLVRKWRPIEWAEELGQIKSGVGPFLEKVARERTPTAFDRSSRRAATRPFAPSRYEAGSHPAACAFPPMRHGGMNLKPSF